MQVRPGRTLCVAWAFAALAGAAHVATVVYKQQVAREYAWASRDIYWMSPLSNFVYFSAVALGLIAFARVAPKRLRQSTAEGILAALGALALLLLAPGIWQYASLLLAIGFGAQWARWSRRHGMRLVTPFAATLGLVGMLTFSGGLALRTLRLRAEARAERLLPAASADAPNILIIVWDTVRAASVSLLGYERPTTPRLERLAESGVVFDWAFAPSPWTLPSHCSMFTGLQHGEHSCRWKTPLDDSVPTLPQLLRDRGYRTGAFVANHFYTTHETGLDRGFTTYSDFQVTPKQLLCASTIGQMGLLRDLFWRRTWSERLHGIVRLRLRGDPKPENDRKVATQVNADFLAWLDEDRDRPFFGFLNLFDAHDPYEPPAPWDRRFAATPSSRDRYDGAIAYMDEQLGRLADELSARGLLDRTIVVVTSDHGELFGEHGLENHGNALYLPLLHVPLVIRYPATLAPGRVANSVSLRDLAISLLDLADGGDSASLPGNSFLRNAGLDDYDEPSSAPMRHHPVLAEVERLELPWGNPPARDGAMHSVIDDEHHFIVDAKGRRQLFAYRRDRAEAHDLATTPAGDSLAAKYQATMSQLTTRLVR